MAGVRYSNVRLMCKHVHSAFNQQSVQSYNSYTNLFLRHVKNQFLGRSYFALANHNLQEKGLEHNRDCRMKMGSVPMSTSVSTCCSRVSFLGTSVGPALSYRSYWSRFTGKSNKPESNGVSAVSRENDGNVGDGGGATLDDWVDKVKDGWQRAADAVTYTGQKAKEVSDELNPHVQQLLDSHPYFKDVVLPVSYTLIGTILAWVVMPRLLRRIHKSVMQSPALILPGKILGEQPSYEQSFWGALEEPVRYLFTFMAFSQIAVMVAPDAIASEYLTRAWRGAAILSFVWFLYRWKTNVFNRAIISKSLAAVERENIFTLDRVSSVGLFIIGMMVLAEACGVAVQSILTVGGIGGVATAFAAKDVLGNILSGFSMQFSKPFTLGDTIKAGNIEGQVVGMGLITTSLVNAEKFPVSVPNSLFSSQIIINKSRAQLRAIIIKVPLRVDVEKVSEISKEMENKLKSNPKVSTEWEEPYCYLSRIDSSAAELTVGCNLRHMRKRELYSTEQDIRLQLVRIIKDHGGALSSSWSDATNQ